MPSPLARALLPLAVVLAAKLDGKPLDTVEDFLGEHDGQHRPGDRVNLTIIRDGREQQMTATLADNPNG